MRDKIVSLTVAAHFDSIADQETWHGPVALAKVSAVVLLLLTGFCA